MWLLSTDCAELHYFAGPEAVKEGYAILSHVWDREEQSFQDLQALREQARERNVSPRDLAGEKIKSCCELAQKHAYRWVWIDTCCIDKTSSAELSEAINSMFRYYSLAHVCYAYLKDVYTENIQDNDDAFLRSSFARSSWHLRGWTLQELLAPRLLVFLSQNWQVIGGREALAPQLEEITRIPAAVLRREQDLREVSIAQRMAWASRRQTTREEDRAYSLFGIFDINLPTLYGEGKQAFQRLQEEILRRYPDTTLFAWGYDSEEVIATNGNHVHFDRSYLFASSPRDFANSHDIRYSTSNLLRHIREPAESVSLIFLSFRARFY